MRFMAVFPGDNKLLLTADQLDALVSAIDGCEALVDTHVGTGGGTHGYNNSYVHSIEVKRTAGWFTVTPVADDYLDAIRLASKLKDSA